MIAVLTSRRRQLVAFVRTRVPAHVDPEDVFQIGAAKAVERCASVADLARVEPWVRRVLARCAADAARAPSRDVPLDDSDAPATPERGDGGCTCSLTLLRSLRPSYRDVLERVDARGASLEDVARELHITKGNAAVRLMRARRALRDRLLAHCRVRSARDCLSCACTTRGCCA